jgi:tRNA pseudouridine13 synthase
VTVLSSAPASYPAFSFDLPYAWGGPAGSGRIRMQPEDFQVFEIPIVSPDGQGEHCWVHVRKRNSNTEWVARQLARFAGVTPSAVSYAGLKDRNAVTEQWFSVQLPGRPDPDWTSLTGQDFEVLTAKRHSRKLKTGALLGNRFCLRIRDVKATTAMLEARLQQVSAGGFPNYFGTQRFGHGGANLVEAERLFKSPQSRLSRHKRGLYLSAVRAALFNQVLAARINDDCWNSALSGDALQLDGKSACFVADSIDDVIGHRLSNLEIHPTGPLCGDGDAMVTGEAARYEANVLKPYSEWVEGLKRFRLAAARRSLRIVPAGLQWRCDTDGSWVLEFSLPSGSYATSLLREIFELDSDE